MARPTLKQAIEEIARARGNVSAAARACGTSRKTFHDMLNKYPKLKEVCDDQRESLIDDAERMLHERIGESDTLLIFFLKTQGKNRGYTERTEHTGADGADLIIRVKYGDIDTNATETTSEAE